MRNGCGPGGGNRFAGGQQGGEGDGVDILILMSYGVAQRTVTSASIRHVCTQTNKEMREQAGLPKSAL